MFISSDGIPSSVAVCWKNFEWSCGVDLAGYPVNVADAARYPTSSLLFTGREVGDGNFNSP